MSRTTRQRDLQRIAFDLGLDYQYEEAYGPLPRLRDFRLFRRGGRKRIRHVLRQQDPLLESDLRIFDYRYVISTGNSARRVEQTVFFLESRRLGLPECWLRPETFFHKVGELLGFGDIDFEEYPRFSGQYRLTGDDEEFIRHHFNDDLLHFFSVEKGWTMEGVGYYLLLYKKGKVLPPDRIRELYTRGQEVYRLLCS